MVYTSIYMRVESMVTFFKLSISALFLLLLISCGSAPIDDGKPVIYVPVTAEDTSTLVYVPTLKVNGKGQRIPYQADVNPYLKRQGSVRSDSVESFIQAKRAFKASDFEGAKTILIGLTDSDKKLSGPWVMLGDIEVEKNNLDVAEQYFSKAILINKNNINAYLRLANVKRMQGDFSKAKSTYADVLSLWKDFPEAHLNLGVLYDVYLNDNVKAQKHIETYQFLTGGENDEVAQWLLEIQSRTGLPTELNIEKQDLPSKPVS